MIFVFGSNLKGIHGAGAALYALRKCGAIVGRGVGLQGQSYAIPTCSIPGKPLPLNVIKQHITLFLEFTRAHADLQFQVTRIGCGFAGYTDKDIAPFFKDAPDNVWLPMGFVNALCELTSNWEVEA